ncbi:hypothetical protein D030_4318B, partial [Vibrio parahaemolyticus AQ3810]
TKGETLDTNAFIDTDCRQHQAKNGHHPRFNDLTFTSKSRNGRQAEQHQRKVIRRLKA